ncbi:MAG: ABC-ATPase domain-containing protein, partial [Desulfurococcales archaeon]|nr:ABC-ATPase domain-containing protein [Desulfurococcales archaeon]
MGNTISLSELKRLIRSIDGRGYGAYKRLKGLVVNYEIAKLRFTKVQGDPHAPPSIAEVVIPPRTHKLPEDLLKPEYITPLTDFIARELYKVTRSVRRKCGSGYSCYVGVPRPGPWILRRSCAEVEARDLVLRFYIGLPARGRRVLGSQAAALLLEDIPKVIRHIVGLRARVSEIRDHIRNYVDQEYLRRWLYERGCIAFVGNGSILPRESSISEKPMKGAIPFKSPETLEVTIELPSGKVVEGMALPEGLTVVTGGGYHGKTTLLEALQEGIYDHIAGDGREYVVSRKYTALVKAEDGRIVSHVDISSFISRLPSGEDTADYVSLDASGSTSMAASISEAIEAGAEVLLIDEDTSATNLLYKDEVMSELIPDDPIKTLDTQVRDLIRKTGVSVVTVMSASSSFLGIADKVIRMRRYLLMRMTLSAMPRNDDDA